MRIYLKHALSQVNLRELVLIIKDASKQYVDQFINITTDLRNTQISEISLEGLLSLVNAVSELVIATEQYSRGADLNDDEKRLLFGDDYYVGGIEKLIINAKQQVILYLRNVYGGVFDKQMANEEQASGIVFDIGSYEEAELISNILTTVQGLPSKDPKTSDALDEYRFILDKKSLSRKIFVTKRNIVRIYLEDGNYHYITFNKFDDLSAELLLGDKTAFQEVIWHKTNYRLFSIEPSSDEQPYLIKELSYGNNNKLIVTLSRFGKDGVEINVDCKFEHLSNVEVIELIPPKKYYATSKYSKENVTLLINKVSSKITSDKVASLLQSGGVRYIFSSTTKDSKVDVELYIYDSLNDRTSSKGKEIGQKVKNKTRVFEYFQKNHLCREVLAGSEHITEYNRNLNTGDVYNSLYSCPSAIYFVEFVLRKILILPNYVGFPLIEGAESLCNLNDYKEKDINKNTTETNPILRKRLMQESLYISNSMRIKLLAQERVEDNILILNEGVAYPKLTACKYKNEICLYIEGLMACNSSNDKKNQSYPEEVSINPKREASRGKVILEGCGQERIEGKEFKVLGYEDGKLYIKLEKSYFHYDIEEGEVFDINKRTIIRKAESDKSTSTINMQKLAIEELLSGTSTKIQKIITGQEPLKNQNNDIEWIVLRNRCIKEDNEQMQFLMHALNGREVELCIGPVGTGKSTVLAEIIYQQHCINRNDLGPIIVTSQTNKAVDGVLLKLKYDYGLRVVRSGSKGNGKTVSQNKYHPDLEENLTSKGKLDIDQTKDFLNSNIVLGGTMHTLSTMGCWDEGNQRYTKLKEVTDRLPTYLYIDEFGVASKGESLSAIRLATSKLFTIGDPKQLGLMQAEKEISNSMRNYFGATERAISSTEQSYFKFLTNQKIFEHPSLKKVYRLLPKLVRLVDIHYRSSEEEQFLIPALKEFEEKVLNQKSLVIFDTSKICSQTINVVEQEADDELWELNEIQAEIGTNIYNKLLTETEFTYKDIAIITPYNNQIEQYKKRFDTLAKQSDKMRNALCNFDQVIGSVYPFQGAERSITIVDLVRHDAILGRLNDDNEFNTGFFSPEMLLVMMSRSKRGPLIIIGNLDTFKNSKLQSIRNLFEHLLVKVVPESGTLVDVASTSAIDINEFIDVWQKHVKPIR